MEALSDSISLRNVCIRADASPEIGMGHVMRCLALADMLKSTFRISFYCKEIPPGLRKQIESKGFSVEQVANEKAFVDSLEAKHIAVLDGYHFDLELQREIKKKEVLLIRIDDMMSESFLADLVINHAPGLLHSEFKVQPYTRLALGEKYALLNSMFLEAARHQLTKKSIDNVLICFGGSDPRNLTERVLKSIKYNSQVKRIRVVLGPGYAHHDTIGPEMQDERVSEHRELSSVEMLDLMKETDLAIVPSSGILYEVLAAGCLVASGYYIDNQKAIYSGFLKNKAFYDLGDFSQMDVLKDLGLAELQDLEAGLIDGKSGERILHLVEEMSS